jgi:hypothetical protein
MNWQTSERKTTANSSYPKGGVLSFTDTFVQAESLVVKSTLLG